MSLTLIQTFLAIVETGSLIKASRRLNLTQSTVTARLQSLEAEVGQELVRRQKSGVTLTASGIKFNRYAQAMANMWQQALLETTLPTGTDVVCNIACEPDLWPTLCRRLVLWIRRAHPRTAINFRQGNGQQIEQWLESGLIDVALTYREMSLVSTSSRIVSREDLFVYSTQSRGSVNSDPNYTYLDAGPDFGRDHALAYSDAGVAKNSFDSAVWCLQHILDYGGSAYLPHKLAAPHVAKGALHKLEAGLPFSRTIHLITRDLALSGFSWLPDLVSGIAKDDDADFSLTADV